MKVSMNSKIGVTFQPTAETIDETGSLIPYGLPCLRELFRFLVSIINPHELSVSVAGSAAANVAASGAHQNEWMIQIALSLLATALETGAEYLVSTFCLI
jgi:brefeldin A-resistance guanine nucleotide exchange factor 1